ncbi:MAG: amino acid ABC transporter permease [Desulfobacterales bacterium]
MILFNRRISLIDIILGLLLFTVAVYVYHRVSSGLQYEWRWELIPQYLLRYDLAEDRWVLNALSRGFLNTIRLSIWGTLLAIVIGVTMGLARISLRPFRRMLGATYVELVRNTPPLVLIFIFYFFVSDQLMPLLEIQSLAEGAPPAVRGFLSVVLAPPSSLPAFLSALITLSLFEGAYITEIVRAGIQSVETGQWEASAALGLSRRQQLFHVVGPQALRRVLPPLSGQFISTIKDSAIVSVISIPELTFRGMELMAATYLTFEIWITITLLYFLLTFSCSLAVERLEMFLNRDRGV